MLKNARKHKHVGYKNILDRWNNDDKCRKYLSDIGWAKDNIIQDDEIALEGHSYTATRQERSQNDKSWKFSLNAEDIQGPLNQRSDFKQAKQTCKRLYQEHTAITGSGNTRIPPEQQVRQRRDQQFEGFEEYDYRLEVSTGPQRIRLHLRHHDGNQTATCGQRGTEFRGNLHPGVSSDFSSIVPDE